MRFKSIPAAGLALGLVLLLPGADAAAQYWVQRGRVLRAAPRRGFRPIVARPRALPVKSRFLSGGSSHVLCTSSRSFDVALQRLNGMLSEPRIVLKARARFRHRVGTSSRSDAQIDRTVTLMRPFTILGGPTTMTHPYRDNRGITGTIWTTCVTVSTQRATVDDKPAPKLSGKIWDFDP